ncbi:phage tail tape measure protein [Haemophilus parahaemolyticus]|uniref:phage tail tape measure protein n=1 Tax=Haemophilus parahaemolyticus TaxID=735 RepID=UPI0029123708|nr:phage tail tape measure protein [Haemophilus parahaemolyticus]MDU4465534.1 phage tail tape measure protein [Haemophilus parahaemolyticus]
MSSLGSLNIQLSLETAQFQQALSKSTAQTQQFAKTFVVDMDKARQSARQFADRTTQYLGNIEKAANNINNAAKWDFRFDNFDRVKAAARQFIAFADANTELSNKIKLVSENELQHAQALAAVYDISMKTAQSTQAVSSVYQTFAQNAKELGINQHQVAEMTEIISKAVSISGASASDAQNALTQFSQVLLMGKFRAQEYNSVMTQTPAVMQAIARGLGVTMAELKVMSDDGKLTTDKIIQGLERSKKSVDELYGKTTTTISGAMQNLSTATEKWVGELNNSLGVSDKAVSAIQAITNNLDLLAKAAIVAGAAYVGIKLGTVAQGRYNHIKAIHTETNATYEKLAASAKEAQANYQTQLAIYQNIQAKQADVVATQAQIQAEQAKLRVLALSATSYAERRLIQTELQALDRVSAELTQKQIFLEQQQIASKQALNVAYRENAIAQSAFVVGTKSSSVAMTAFKTISASVTTEMNALKVAMLSNPITLGLTAILTTASFLGLFSDSTNEATEAALRYADSIDQARNNLEQMAKVQVAAELVKTKQSIEEQEKSVAQLRLEQQRLINATKSKIDVDYTNLGVAVETAKSDKEMSELKDKLTLKTAEVEEAQSKLNKTLEWQRDLKAHESVANLKEQFSALFPQVDQSQIKVDGLNVSVGNLTVTLPQATIEALKFARAIGSIATGAIQAAVAVANLNNVSGGQLGETAQKMIRLNQIEGELSEAKKGKNKKRIAELEVERAELSGRYKDLQGKDLEAVKASDFEKYQRQAQEGFSKGSKKGRSGSKTKSGEDYRNDWDKYYDDLVNANATAWEKIRYEQEVAARELDKHLSHGVVSQAEAEKARTLIGQQYAKQRMELAGQYIPEIAYREKIKTQLKDLEQLEKDGTLTIEQAARARQNLGAKYVPVVAVMEEYRQKLAEIAELEQRGIINNSQANEARADAEYEKWKGTADKSDPMNGIRQGWEEWAKTAGNTMEQVANITTQAFDGMADQFTNFVMTGKADFRSLTVSILSDISKMIIKMMILNAVKAAFGGFSGGGLVGGTEVNGNATYGMGTWATGGYTGNGGKYEPAGIVHKGEYVITKEATARLGTGYLDYLNYGKRGFANGGGVAVPTLPTMYYQPSQANTGRISVNVINNGEPMEANVSQKERNGQMEITIELMRQIARNETNNVLQSNFRAGGMFAR